MRDGKDKVRYVCRVVGSIGSIESEVRTGQNKRPRLEAGSRPPHRRFLTSEIRYELIAVEVTIEAEVKVEEALTSLCPPHPGGKLLPYPVQPLRVDFPDGSDE